jgi:hypothetical protein
MTGNPWDKPAVVPAPPTCAVCGEAVGRQPVIVAPPHTYHRDCYAAFHAAMNDRANLDKTIAEIRALVAAA